LNALATTYLFPTGALLGGNSVAIHTTVDLANSGSQSGIDRMATL